MMAGPLKRVSLGSSTSFLLLLPRDVASLRFSSSLVLSSTTNQVTTITMNNPKKYNAWDMTLCTQLAEKFHEAAENSNTKVVVYTGAGKYHCAGVCLSSWGVKHRDSFKGLLGRTMRKCSTCSLNSRSQSS